MSKTLRKLVQRRLYDLLSNRNVLCWTLVTCATLITIFIFSEILVNWSKTKYINLFLSCGDNIGISSRERELCEYVPIDAVYTWVNGSDPLLIQALNAAQNEIRAKYNISSKALPSESCARKDDNFYLEMPLVWIQPFRTDLLPGLPRAWKAKIETDKEEGNLLYFKDVKEAQEATKRKSFIYQGGKYEIFSTFIKVSCHTRGLVEKYEEEEDPLLKTVASSSLIFLSGAWSRHQIVKSISEREQTFIHHILIDDNKSWALIFLNNVRGAANVANLISGQLNNTWSKKKMFRISKTVRFIVGSHYFFSRGSRLDQISQKRFADNEELRYSLRSLQKFAPWVRRVYIVTNGQIPYWLNLQNPRVRIITHQEIFENEDDLPTFNSAAIEAHLHRIPGLSQRFLYLNDDTLFGKKVYPEDFYTRSDGYKVYLTWPVPDCAPNCPTNWIKDGFCDPTCNNSACNWDGGDCSSSKFGTIFRHHSAREEHASRSEASYCHLNCPNNWLADKFCDNVCNNEECAYDLGDCGLENYHKLVAVDCSTSSNVHLPLTNAFFISLSNLIGADEEFEIEEAFYEKNNNVRKMAINLEEKVLTALLYNKTQTNVTILVKRKIQNNSSQVLLSVKLCEKHVKKRNGTRAEASRSTLRVNEPSQNRQREKWLALRTYSPMEEGPKILKDYLDLFNQSLRLTTEKRNASERYPEDVELSMAAVEDQRKRGYLTERGLLFEKYKLLASRGFLPWEKQGALRDIEKLISTYEEYAHQSKKSARHLMDVFAESLRYVNRLYDQAFGVESRRVPAHMAHLLDVSIVERFQDSFREEIRKTSSHRIRSSEDMQFGFSYFYFLMAEARKTNLTELLRELDADSSGFLSWNELATLMARMEDSLSEVDAFRRYSKSCFNWTMDKENEIEVQLSINQVLSCTSLTEKMEKRYSGTKRNPHQIVSDEEVAFKMVSSNYTRLKKELRDLRRKPTKFICLNDDIDHDGSKESQLVKKMLVDFYKSFLPTPSQFELPSTQMNPFHDVYQFNEWSKSQSLHFKPAYALFFVILALFIIFRIKRRLIKRLLPFRHRRHFLRFWKPYNV